ncbi:MAG: carbamoyltransferase HypF [Nitrospinales bacterium]
MRDHFIARKLAINGIVQGVGFRPFVYQLANRYGVNGEVANTLDGVSIHVEGTQTPVDYFSMEVGKNNPPRAVISDIKGISASVIGFKDFSITHSKKQGPPATLISPDVSICSECIQELFDPEDCRYQYPFINCTNCGPRYTIIKDVPYDRCNTTMKFFKLCEMCQNEYNSPSERRFHAQPNACPACGPKVLLYDGDGKHLTTNDPIKKAVILLEQGHIIAIKGLGGFHLVADAENHKVVIRLRERKQREEKPFAVMSFDIDRIRNYAHFESEDTILLSSIQRPIVLLKKRNPNSLSKGIAPRNKYFGVMLPYTPLHYLLLKDRFRALVMTSGNMSDEPIAIDNFDAFEQLSSVADYFLVHNRDIYLRTDDSIVKRSAGSTRLIRRSRGYVPTPIILKKSLPQVLACGPELKNTICLTKDRKAFLSQHIGDLKNISTYTFFKSTIEHLKRVLGVDPQIVSHDLHPDYLSTRYARDLHNVTKIAVQHHHAHIVSCMAENLIDSPVIGLAFDGTGYGTDGKIWGGEILVTEYDKFERVAHLSYIPMPGGSSAIKEPWRMAVSYLYDAYKDKLWDLNLSLFNQISEQKIKIVIEMISKNLNSPVTSSLGRLFDGVSGILGIRSYCNFEGQAAMELEMLGDENIQATYDYNWTSGEVYRIELKPVICGIVEDIEKGIPCSIISGKFHRTIASMFSRLCIIVRKDRGINEVVLSGGVFQNSFLLTVMTQTLERQGFKVYSHLRIPTNDGGIALGQALVAAHTVEESKITFY